MKHGGQIVGRSPMTTEPANDSTVGSGERVEGHDEFLTVVDVATRLRVHPQTVRGWIARGELGAVRMGRTIRIPRSRFEELLERARIAPAVRTLSPDRPGSAAGGGSACSEPLAGE